MVKDEANSISIGDGGGEDLLRVSRFANTDVVVTTDLISITGPMSTCYHQGGVTLYQPGFREKVTAMTG